MGTSVPRKTYHQPHLQGQFAVEKSVNVCESEEQKCTVLKEHPILDVEPKRKSTMKLTRKKIRWIIRQKERQESSGIIGKIQRVTRRGVDQLWKQYRETGIISGIGAALGRPKKPITAEESGVIDNAFERFSAWSEDVGDADLERQSRKYFS